jgi:hypothetical protein
LLAIVREAKHRAPHESSIDGIAGRSMLREIEFRLEHAEKAARRA